MGRKRFLMTVFMMLALWPASGVFAAEKPKSSKLDNAVRRYTILADNNDFEARKLFCDSMFVLAKEEKNLTYEWLAENLLFLQSWMENKPEEEILSHIRREKEICLALNDIDEYYNALTNEISVMCAYGHSYEAYKLGTKVLEDARKANNRKALIAANTIMANIHGSRSDKFLAYSYAKEAMGIFLDSKEINEGNMVDLSYTLSSFALDANKNEEALRWTDSTLRYNPSYRDVYYIKALASFRTGKIDDFWKYHNMGEELGKTNPVTQEDILPYSQALAAALGKHEEKIPEILSRTNRNVSSLYRLNCELFSINGDYRKAYEYLNDLFYMEDSLRAFRNMSEMQEMMAELNHSIEARQAEYDRQRERMYYILGLVGMLLVIIALGFIIIVHTRRLAKRQSALLGELEISQVKKKKAYEQLEMASLYKEHIIDELAQQIRANFNVIKGYGELFVHENTKEGFSSEDKIAALESMEEGYRNIDTFIKDLKQANSSTEMDEVPTMAHYKINDLARQAIKEEWARPWEECPVDFQTEADEECKVLTDYYRSKSIIRSAIHFISQFCGAELIFLVCHVDDAGREIIFRVFHKGSTLPKNVSSSIFDRYFKYGEKQYEGLYTTRRLASSIMATMSYEALDPQGDVIIIKIPHQM